MTAQDKKDADLIVVAAVEEYGWRHKMSSQDVIKLFNEHGILKLIRSQYEVLHMLDLGEGALFAEEILNEAAYE